MTTPEELRRRAAELEDLRRRGIADAGFVPRDDGKLLGTMGGGGGRAEFRFTWATPVDRAPQMRVRMWVDEGTGMYPKRGVGFDVPFYQMAEFSRAVAEGLEYAIEHQKEVMSNRNHRSFDARRR